MLILFDIVVVFSFSRQIAIKIMLLPEHLMLSLVTC